MKLFAAVMNCINKALYVLLSSTNVVMERTKIIFIKITRLVPSQVNTSSSEVDSMSYIVTKPEKMTYVMILLIAESVAVML